MSVEKLPVYPFDSARAIGTITEVTGTSAKLNLPKAAVPGSMWHHGSNLEAGRVGEFVVIEASDHAVFGRVVSVRLPEKERLSVEEELGKSGEANPIGFVQMMATVALKDGRIEAGVPVHPRLGARCFSAHPELIQWLAQHSNAIKRDDAMLLDIAVLPFSKDTTISIAPESLFGRHCAVLGATGGGKSWTIARLMEQVCRFGAKVLLIDATGEFHTQQGPHIVHAYIGNDPDSRGISGAKETFYPYSKLTEGDLFALFRPSAQSQAPKLRAAMKSLKLAQLEPSLADAGILRKANKPRGPFEAAAVTHAKSLENQDAMFHIKHLKDQIGEECLAFNHSDPTKYGKVDERDLGFCSNLIQRVEHMVSAPELACIFRPKTGTQADFVKDILKPFLADRNQRLLRLSLKELSFEHNVREVLANAIGRYLLAQARDGVFRECPLIVILDEAHQFLGKAIGDEVSQMRLDAFELIAKEGRKYSLTICLATQRPRDLGQGVLSQMGTYLVHRLTNPEDRELVEKAAGDLDRSAASFIPTLAAGQAILIGIDFPIPVTLQMLPPERKPASSGPRYQAHWRLNDA